jgi:hypothetical protein
MAIVLCKQGLQAAQSWLLHPTLARASKEQLVEIWAKWVTEGWLVTMCASCQYAEHLLWF